MDDVTKFRDARYDSLRNRFIMDYELSLSHQELGQPPYDFVPLVISGFHALCDRNKVAQAAFRENATMIYNYYHAPPGEPIDPQPIQTITFVRSDCEDR